MSKPVFEDLFKFSGRRNRKSFILIHLASLAAIVFGTGLITILSALVPVAAPFFIVVGVVGLIAIGVSLWAVASQRVRDFGQSGVWALIMLIPYVGPVFSIALWLVPSDVGENKYGPSCI